MKKVSILLLLAVVLVSFTFAIDGIGDFKAGLEVTVPNVGSGDDGHPFVSAEPSINYSRSFGAVGLSATLGDYFEYDTDKDETPAKNAVKDNVYLEVVPSYALSAGPGDLGLSLAVKAEFNVASYAKDTADPVFYINPKVTYGFNPGFGDLAFALGTDSLSLSATHGDKKDSYGVDRVEVYFQAGLALDFGLSFSVKPYLGIQADDKTDKLDTGLDKIVFDVGYVIAADQFTTGVEVVLPTHSDNGIAEAGLEVTPRFEASFGPLNAYVKVNLSHIGIDKKNNKGNDDLLIKPILGVGYKF